MGSALAATASLGAYHYANEPNSIEYDVDGNALTLMQLSQPSFLTNLMSEEDGLN
jgi:hypothetical protein